MCAHSATLSESVGAVAVVCSLDHSGLDNVRKYAMTPGQVARQVAMHSSLIGAVAAVCSLDDSNLERNRKKHADAGTSC